MVKKILVLTLTFIIIFTSSVFAYQWVSDGDYWYVVDETKGEFLEHALYDVGSDVYLLGVEGKMVKGWWRNADTNSDYFFSNKHDKDYGGMLFGLHVIDGYTRYFNDNGTLATSDSKGTYKNVYGEYYADFNGNLYYSNKLLRDTSNAKSEFYTNELYYTHETLNNFFLANYDLGFRNLEVVPSGLTAAKTVRTRDMAIDGQDYAVDIGGRTISSKITTNGISSLEKIGPRANME